MNNFTRTFIYIFFLLFVPVYGYTNVEEKVIRAVERVESSVVNVKVIRVSPYSGAVGRGLGSGVIISSDGWIITNAHVIQNARKIFITLPDKNKTTHTAVEWRADPSQDIAVIKIRARNLPTAPIGNSNNLKKGQIAIAIGNPWKFSSTVTVGCISATGRNIQMSSIVLRDMIQTDAAINPGNSGGALVDSDGYVIGINTIVYTGTYTKYAQGLGFAIPINQAMAVARRLIRMKEKSKVKAWLGVAVQTVSPNMGFRVRGAIITGFPPYSPARKAGLRVGDIIISVNDKPIHSAKDLGKAIQRQKPGDKIYIIVIRGNKKLKGFVKLEGMRQ